MTSLSFDRNALITLLQDIDKDIEQREKIRVSREKQYHEEFFSDLVDEQEQTILKEKRKAELREICKLQCT